MVTTTSNSTVSSFSNTDRNDLVNGNTEDYLKQKTKTTYKLVDEDLSKGKYMDLLRS